MGRVCCVNDHRIRFLFLADMQLGAYASVSGLDQAALEQLAARDIHVDAVPEVVGFEWDADRYRQAVAMANSIRPDFVVIGGDMVEVSPPFDPSGMTAMNGATIAFEMLCLLAQRFA